MVGTPAAAGRPETASPGAATWPVAAGSPDAAAWPDSDPDRVMVRAEGLGRRFGDVWAVEDLDFELRRGEVFGLLGPNGAGKTTTVRMLTALIAPTVGTASVDGFDVRTDPEAVRARIGLLTETPSLYERLTATQNLEFFGRLHELPDDVRTERIEKLLRLFELWNRRRDLVGEFSKGMKQKLAIARALLHEPAVLFFDEPTSALDPEAAFIVRDAMESLKSGGRTIVLCTHNLDEAERLCDRVAFLRRGILRVDSPARLRASAGLPTVEIDLAEPPSEPLLANLHGLASIHDITAHGTGISVVVGDARRDTPTLVRALAAAGVDVLGVRVASATLESVYFDVMGLRPGANADSV
ncbi:MAG TPA: ABC transporter ATP-binding protein [Candidatus Saccharimonadales bacterium]|nr:ABC transporter ATP-binding protein [Candidatus Saccharimonadales bacterium]